MNLTIEAGLDESRVLTLDISENTIQTGLAVPGAVPIRHALTTKAIDRSVVTYKGSYNFNLTEADKQYYFFQNIEMNRREVIKCVLDGKKPPYTPWSFKFTLEPKKLLQDYYNKEDLDNVLYNHFLLLGNDYGFFDQIGENLYRDVFGAVWESRDTVAYGELGYTVNDYNKNSVKYIFMERNWPSDMVRGDYSSNNLKNDLQDLSIRWEKLGITIPVLLISIWD